jgi:hypothetical protein
MSYEGMAGGDGREMRCILHVLVPKATIWRETDSLLCAIVGRFVFVGYHDGYRYPIEMKDMECFHRQLFVA